MYNIEFYEKGNGDSEIWDFLEWLRLKGETSKDARIQYKQLMFYIDLLSKNGTNLPNNITKHIVEDIWELRPGNNRVFYFSYETGQFVLFHYFRKKSQKTPRREIEIAKRNKKDYLQRKGGNINENLGRL